MKRILFVLFVVFPVVSLANKNYTSPEEMSYLWNVENKFVVMDNIEKNIKKSHSAKFAAKASADISEKIWVLSQNVNKPNQEEITKDVAAERSRYIGQNLFIGGGNKHVSGTVMVNNWGVSNNKQDSEGEENSLRIDGLYRQYIAALNLSLSEALNLPAKGIWSLGVARTKSPKFKYSENLDRHYYSYYNPQKTTTPPEFFSYLNVSGLSIGSHIEDGKLDAYNFSYAFNVGGLSNKFSYLGASESLEGERANEEKHKFIKYGLGLNSGGSGYEAGKINIQGRYKLDEKKINYVAIGGSIGNELIGPGSGEPAGVGFGIKARGVKIGETEIKYAEKTGYNVGCFVFWPESGSFGGGKITLGVKKNNYGSEGFVYRDANLFYLDIEGRVL